MNCELREKTGLYVDGELEPAAQQAFANHLQSCSGCAAAVVEQQQLKKAIRIAGKRFSAPPDLYASVRQQIHPQKAPSAWWRWGLVAACMLLFIGLGTSWLLRSREENSVMAQMADLHVIMLAGQHPMDVISEDRHTVKPWFQGRIPFTFNLPELANSDFKLLGGNLVYARSTPGAELIYQIRQHKISVFIFQSRDVHGQPSNQGNVFTAKDWQQRGLQYYLVTDTSKEDADRLQALLEEANR